MSATFFVGASILLAFFLYKLANLAYYIHLARSIGLPYAITPVSENDPLGLMIAPILRHIYDKRIENGQGWPRWCRFFIKSWNWEDKRRAHDEYGDVFLCVSPEGIMCYSADAQMGWDIMNRKNDFTKPHDVYKILELYGPTVASVEGATYRFHIRITAPSFSDGSGVNELVWEETMYQSRRLSRLLAKNPDRDMRMDIRGLTLAVISRAAFAKPIYHDEGEEETGSDAIPEGYSMSFQQAMYLTTAHLLTILILPRWLISSPLLKYTPLRQTHIAYNNLGRYIRDIIAQERRQLYADKNHESSVAKGNVLTAILRASISDSQTAGKSDAASLGVRKEAFNDEEVLGNLYVFLVGGYESSANSIYYGLLCMALYPEIQKTAIEEIDAVYASALRNGFNELSYGEHFPKLEYLYAFMYEVFRLYPNLLHLTKVALNPQYITPSRPASSGSLSIPTGSNAGAHLLPAGTKVVLSAPGVHYNPEYWPDPYNLDPNRWLNRTWTFQEGHDRRVTAADKTRQMRGKLLTFSDGARACLGRKFAQAEFMAFFAALLRDYTVRLAPGVDPEILQRDLRRKSAGNVSLSPPYTPRLMLEKRQMRI
ncbi:putative cytochrome P450 oxidoreductase [Thozetella sp. PMI_491]|nr:putative cytochrome P450 oxidoreductase [Thozetella sp. PMI_491]